MPWFVLRVSIGRQPRVFMHGEEYPSKEAAEQVAWDDSRIENKPRPGEPVNDNFPPFVVEASDRREAIRKYADYWLERREELK